MQEQTTMCQLTCKIYEAGFTLARVTKHKSTKITQIYKPKEAHNKPLKYQTAISCEIIITKK